MLEAVRKRPWRGDGSHHQLHQAFEEAVADGCYLCARFQRSCQRESQSRDLVPSNDDGQPVFNMTFFYDPLIKPYEVARMRLSLHRYVPGSSHHVLWDMVPIQEDKIHKDCLSKANCQFTSSTGSKESLAIANWWLSTCIQKHTQCARPQPSSLRDWRPTRLLHVGSGSDDIRLYEGRGVPIGVQYATLSHCWGKGLERKTLTRRNIAAWTLAIPDSELMYIFKNAVETTRNLGLRYLWIDSLCIIQDSEADWLHESSLMCNVYKYSYCTIAATAAADDASGCFSDRDSQLDLPIQFDFSDFASQSHLSSVIKEPSEKLGDTMLIGITERHQSSLSWLDEIEFSPLFARGWVLQEVTIAQAVVDPDLT